MAIQRVQYTGSINKAGKKKGEAIFLFEKQTTEKGKTIFLDDKKEKVKVTETEIFQDKYWENLARGTAISLGLETNVNNTRHEEDGYFLRKIIYKKKTYQVLRISLKASDIAFLDLEEEN